MKQQIIKIIESHRPPMIHPTNRSGGEYLVACEVDRILDEVIRDVENIKPNEQTLPEYMFKCDKCKNPLVGTRGQGMYCGICKN